MMGKSIWRAAAALALAPALAGLVASIAAPVLAEPFKPAPVDWTRRVSPTREGGYAIGNPRARLTLLEFGSLTCSHCAAFERDGAAPLMAYVRAGTLRWEFRNWVRDRLDIAAALTARCGGGRRMFALNHRLFMAQDQWVDLGSGAQADRLESLPLADEMKGLARLSGIDAIAIQSGLPPRQLARCLSDRAEAGRLTAIRNSPAGLAVEGTPTFFLNGVEVVPTQMDRWPGIEAAIKARLAR